MSNVDQEKSKEWQEGLNAFHEGVGAETPYPQESKEAKDWLGGYKEAKDAQAILHKLRKSKPFATVTFGEQVDIIGGQVVGAQVDIADK